MKATLKISEETIANLMISAIESGDPVTTAARGGWCSGVYLLAGKSRDSLWYADAELYASRSFTLEIVEVDDETTGHETKHMIKAADMERGLSAMAAKYPRQFAQVISGDTDAPCADIFLQCVLFGEEKYA